MRRLARHSFTAAAALSLALLLLLLTCEKGDGWQFGSWSAWATGGNFNVTWLHPLDDSDDWEWQAGGFSIGTISGRSRQTWVQVPLRLAFPAQSALPVAWLVTRLVLRRKRPARGFVAEPNGVGEER